MPQLHLRYLLLVAIFLFFNHYNTFELPAAVANRSPAGLALIQSVCLDTKKLGGHHYDLCIASLKSDHRSYKINKLNDMIRLSVEVAFANAQQTRSLIQKHAMSQQGLKDCSKRFDYVVRSIQSCLETFDANINEGLEGNMVMMDWAGTNATACLKSLKKLKLLQMKSGLNLLVRIQQARLISRNVEEILGMAAV